jgi:thiamine biosynthesis protein ThiS
MKIQINGQEKELSVSTVAELVEQLGLKGDRLAIELNRDIVPRAKWAETPVHEGDKLEMVHFVGGGSDVFTTETQSSQS